MNEVNERVTPIGNEFYGGDPSSLRAIERMPLIAAWLAFHLLERSVSFHCRLFSYVGCSAKCQNKLTANILKQTLCFTHFEMQDKTNLANCNVKYQVRDQDWINLILFRIVEVNIFWLPPKMITKQNRKTNSQKKMLKTGKCMQILCIKSLR